MVSKRSRGRRGLGDDQSGPYVFNRSGRDVLYLEIGDRLPGDEVAYPDDDLALPHRPDAGSDAFTRKDGTAY